MVCIRCWWGLQRAKLACPLWKVPSDEWGFARRIFRGLWHFSPLKSTLQRSGFDQILVLKMSPFFPPPTLLGRRSHSLVTHGWFELILSQVVAEIAEDLTALAGLGAEWQKVRVNWLHNAVAIVFVGLVPPEPSTVYPISCLFNCSFCISSSGRPSSDESLSLHRKSSSNQHNTKSKWAASQLQTLLCLDYCNPSKTMAQQVFFYYYHHIILWNSVLYVFFRLCRNPGSLWIDGSEI